jgi:RND family efflux transporter MFP subunit
MKAHIKIKSYRRIPQSLCFVVVLIFFSFLTGCGLLPREEEVTPPELVSNTKPDYNIVEMKKSTFVYKLEGDGSMISTKQQMLSFRLGGNYIVEINAYEGKRVKKGDILLRLDSDNIKSSIKLEEVKIKMAQLNYDKLKSIKASETEIKKAELELELEKNKLDNLRQQLDSTNLYATMDGIIVYAKRMNLGDRVFSRDPLFQIADPKDLQICYQGMDAASLKIGMKVNIQYNEKNYSGKIAAKSDNMQAFIQLDTIPPDAIFGSTMKINVEVFRKDNTFVLPKDSVYVSDNKYYVIVYENSTRNERFVETGLESDTQIEITKGLNEGDKVIVNSLPKQ